MEAEESRGETPGMGQALFCALGGWCGCGMGFMWGPGGSAGSASCSDLHLFSLQSSWDLPSA